MALHAVEERVLGVLAEGAHAPEQIAAILRVAEATVRETLVSLRERGYVEVSALFTQPPESEPRVDATYWRITDAGRARLEDLRSSSA